MLLLQYTSTAFFFYGFVAPRSPENVVLMGSYRRTITRGVSLYRKKLVVVGLELEVGVMIGRRRLCCFVRCCCCCFSQGCSHLFRTASG